MYVCKFSSTVFTLIALHIQHFHGYALLSLLQVIVTPRMSSNLTFSASYQSDNGGNSISQSLDCPFNCTAHLAVGVIPSNVVIESVNVEVSGPFGDSSTMRITNLG